MTVPPVPQPGEVCPCCKRRYPHGKQGRPRHPIGQEKVMSWGKAVKNGDNKDEWFIKVADDPPESRPHAKLLSGGRSLWLRKAVYLWEQAHGVTLTNQDHIHFKDGNRLNCVLANIKVQNG